MLTNPSAPRRPSRHSLVGVATALALVLVPALALALVAGPVRAAQAERYTPRPGVTFNYPLSKDPAERRAIVAKILKSVDAAPPGSTIRFASWNIRGYNVVNALIAAHRRGVDVRVIMDRQNAFRDNVNKAINLLQGELKRYGNRRRPPQERSGLTKCRSSCRGYSGFAHSKFFLFSKAGKARQVVINTSSNATDLAANNQWNDAYTIVGDQATYDLFASVFDQMYLDHPVPQPYVGGSSGSTYAEFYPYRGEGTDVDPVIRELQQVQCRGASNDPGGRTRIQISMTSWFGERGIAIAQKLIGLEHEGCRLKIVYAVMGGEVNRMLRRQRVPLRHIVQDFDRDGVYDRYLHQKVMTIRGNYAGNPGSWITFNGSSNWSPLSLLSDEATLRISDPRTLKQYNRYIDGLFRNPPPNRFGAPIQGTVNGGEDSRSARAARAGGARDPLRDPAYAKVQTD